MLSARQLKERHRREREAQPKQLAVRIHRAISWLDRAEQAQDLDGKFIYLWISFNAAYSQNQYSELRSSDAELFKSFIDTIVALDQAKVLYHQLWSEFTQSVRVLLDNQYIYQPYWNHLNGIEGYEDWQQSFNDAKRVAITAIINKDTAVAMQVVFTRLYTLRNQIMHGGSTYDSSANRQQLRDGVKILSALTPLIIEIMMNHPDEYWAPHSYPVV